MSPGCVLLGSLLNKSCLVLLRSFLSDFVLRSRNNGMYGESWWWWCAPISSNVVINPCFNMVANASNKKNENHSLDLCW